MAILTVRKFPDPVLSARAVEITRITQDDQVLVDDMIETMYAEHGVGLAANQVGVLKRVFVASPDLVKGEELVIFNPVITRREGWLREQEGCLSVPELYEPVKRSRRVWLKGLDRQGRAIEMKAEGLLSRIFQHELDHLDGVLFVERVSMWRAGSVKKRLSRQAGARS